MMRILLFGIVKDIVGVDKLDIKLDIPKNVGDLKKYLVKKYPELGNLSSLAIALNNEYATEEMTLTIQDEIAIIPPVSGG
jgi:molybdopterin converting factor subunit 1